MLRGSFFTGFILAAFLFGAACTENPWLTPAPATPAPPLPALEAPLAAAGLNPGAGGRDSSGSFIPAMSGEKITFTAGAGGQLKVVIPVALPKGMTLSSFRDAESGVILANNNLVIPVTDRTGRVAITLLAAVRPLEGTGEGAEGVIDRLELETIPLEADLSFSDPKLGIVSFQLKAELKSVPGGAGLRVGLTKSPDAAVSDAFSLAAARVGNRLEDIAFTAQVTKTRLVDGKDIEPGMVTVSSGRAWADGVGIQNIAIAALADGGVAALLPAQFVTYTPDGKAIFTAQSQSGMSTFGLVALGRAAPTPVPGPAYYTLTVINDTPDYGTVRVEPASTGNKYPQGAPVVLRAAAAGPGYKFDRWEGDVAGTSDELRVVVDSDKTIAAVFTLQGFEINTGSEPASGGTVEISPYLSSYDYGTRVIVMAIASPGFEFRYWSGDVQSTNNPVPLLVNRPKSLTANFSLVGNSFTTSVNPPGAGTVGPPGGNMETNFRLILTATPSPGYTFSFWSGDASGKDNPIAITLDRNKRIVANFTKNQYGLAIQALPSSGGSVRPPGGVYYHEEPVRLTATANPDYIFSHWSGDVSGSQNPRTVTITKDTKVIANFAPRRYRLNVTINPPMGGFINPIPESDYAAGAVVLLSANPSTNHMFVSWSGDIASNEPFITVEMNRDLNLTANFRYVPPLPPRLPPP